MWEENCHSHREKIIENLPEIKKAYQNTARVIQGKILPFIPLELSYIIVENLLGDSVLVCNVFELHFIGDSLVLLD